MNTYSLFKKSRKNKVDFIIMMSISLLPFLFYVYDFIPNTKIWKTAMFEMNSGYYEDLKSLTWYLSIKTLTLFLLSLWYLSCSHKWRIIIFFPIMAEISKIIFLIKSVKQVLGNEFFIFEAVLYSTPYLLFLIFISNKLVYSKKENCNNVKFNEEINNEIANLSNFKTKDYLTIKKELIQLLKNKNTLNRREYLVKLIALRDRITV